MHNYVIFAVICSFVCLSYFLNSFFGEGILGIMILIKFILSYCLLLKKLFRNIILKNEEHFVLMMIKFDQKNIGFCLSISLKQIIIL